MKLGRGVWSEYKARVALVAVITASLASTAQAQQLNLGEVSFPTSARSEKAQTHFLRGVAALHSFARSGEHEEAASRYAHFLRQWRSADGQLTELHEAQAYGQQASAQ